MKWIIHALMMLHATVAMASGQSIDKKNPQKKLLIAEKNGIEDQWIVVLGKRGSQDVPGTVGELTKKYGVAKTNHIYTKVLKGFSANMPAEVVAAMSEDPNVAYIEQDQHTKLLSVASWGLDRIDDKDLPLDDSYVPAYSNHGKGVTAYILDTGINPTHSQFGGRASTYVDFVEGDGIDLHGHGTAVAGVIGSSIHGVAKSVTLVALRVCPCARGDEEECDCPASAIIAGVNYVAQQTGPRVANISIGDGGLIHALDAAIAEAVDAGVTFVVAAGNLDVDACEHSPAAEETTITVGATEQDDSRKRMIGWDPSWGSNFGQCVDIFAPGKDIITTGLSDDTEIYCQGTSCASPHVCGAAALVLGDYPHLTPAQVRAKIMNDAVLDIVKAASSDNNRMLYVGPIPCKKAGSPCVVARDCCPSTKCSLGTCVSTLYLKTWWPEYWFWMGILCSAAALVVTMRMALSGRFGGKQVMSRKTKGD